MPIFRLTGKDSIETQTEVEIPEERLRAIFENHGLVFIEDGLVLVDRNVSVKAGSIDTLAVDAEGRPVVIEYKVDKDATASALVQALAYATGLKEEEDRFAKLIAHKEDKRAGLSELDFDSTRIVLVAPGFDLKVVEASKRVDLSTRLIRYTLYGDKEGHADTLGTETIFDTDEHQRAPVTGRHYDAGWHFSGRYVAMQETFERLAEEVERATGVRAYFRQEFIAFRRNYIFVDIHVYTDRLEVGLHLPKDPPMPPFLRAPESWGSSRITHIIRIRSPDEVTPDLMEWVKVSYENS